MLTLTFERLHRDAVLPQRALPNDAGLDLSACIISESGRPLTWTIPPGITRRIPTGLRIKPPPGVAVLVLSRSGMAERSLFVANAPGLIDPEYRGEVCVLLYNGSKEPEYIKHGDRIAQIILHQVIPVSITEASINPRETLRGDLGFGSSGT